MIYTILISIVFIAELIITISIFQNLIKLDKAVINSSETINEFRPKIKEVCELGKKISYQILVIADGYVSDLEDKKSDFLANQFSKILMGFLALKINKKIFGKFKNSLLKKIITKGLSVIQLVV